MKYKINSTNINKKIKSVFSKRKSCPYLTKPIKKNHNKFLNFLFPCRKFPFPFPLLIQLNLLTLSGNSSGNSIIC